MSEPVREVASSRSCGSRGVMRGAVVLVGIFALSTSLREAPAFAGLFASQQSCERARLSRLRERCQRVVACRGYRMVGRRVPLANGGAYEYQEKVCDEWVPLGWAKIYELGYLGNQLTYTGVPDRGEGEFGLTIQGLMAPQLGASPVCGMIGADLGFSHSFRGDDRSHGSFRWDLLHLGVGLCARGGWGSAIIGPTVGFGWQDLTGAASTWEVPVGALLRGNVGAIGGGLWARWSHALRDERSRGGVFDPDDRVIGAWVGYGYLVASVTVEEVAGIELTRVGLGYGLP